MSVVYSDKQRSQYVAENDDIYIYIYIIIQTVLNLPSMHLSDDDYILLEKGWKFCLKPRSHDKIKLAE
mgnify:CR=1 FL=1